MFVTKIFSLKESTLIYKKHLTVNHEIFLSNLKHYRIKVTSLNWFKLFLYERIQCILMKESESYLKISISQCITRFYTWSSLIYPLHP